MTKLDLLDINDRGDQDFDNLVTTMNRPGSETVATVSPNTAASKRGLRGLAAAHGWKMLAAAGLLGGVWACQVSFFGPLRVGAVDSARTESSDDVIDVASQRSPQHFGVVRDLIDKQSQPATIVFKNQAPPVIGYLATADQECVILRSLYKEEAKEQTILIPWENVLYIRLNTKVPATQSEMTASHVARPAPSDRLRR